MKTFHDFGLWSSRDEADDETIVIDCEKWCHRPYLAVNGREHAACLLIDHGVNADAYNTKPKGQI